MIKQGAKVIKYKQVVKNFSKISCCSEKMGRIMADFSYFEA